MVTMPFARVYPNLLVLWVAATSIFHKTTAMDVDRDLARDHVPHVLGCQDVTTEALLADLDGFLRPG
jgi:hypothetical protein